MPKITHRTAFTERSEAADAAEHLCEQLGSARPKLAVAFVSRARDQHALNRALRERLPDDTRLLACTTGGEIDNAGIHFGGIALSAMEGDFDVGIGWGGGLSTDAMAAGAQALKSASQQLGKRPQDLDTRSHVGFVVDDAFKYKKEELLLGALDKNQGLVLVGGGAGDTEQDPEKQSARIHVDGEVFDDGVAIVLLSTQAPWAALRHHAYKPLGETMTITKVADDGQRALEIDDKPAVERYCEMLGVGADELEFGLPDGFSRRPIALKVGREHFMRSPWKPMPDGSIMFPNLVQEDTEYELMEQGDMPSMMREFFESELPQRVNNPQGCLAVHCSARLWIAQISETLPELSAAFAAAPPIAGMNGYFETYCGFNINTTLTCLAFGADE